MFLLLVASAKVLGAGPDVATVGVGGNGALFDESQLRLEGELDPLGPSADQMLASFGDGSALAKSAEAKAEAFPVPSPSIPMGNTETGSTNLQKERVESDNSLFTASVGDLLALQASNATKAAKTNDGDNANSVPGLDSFGQGELFDPEVAEAKAVSGGGLAANAPHSALMQSALDAKAKSAMWSKATLKAVQASVNSRQLADDHWATDALRTTGGIVATIDDDYPYQCHCSRKSAADAVKAGMLNPTTPGQSAQAMVETEAEAEQEAQTKKELEYTGVCTHHPDEECMAIPGDHAALLSVALLALA